tara:strand:- start:5477 stop:6295 length:819 start_codon:yes stop_codon:yes gene_type:complete
MPSLFKAKTNQGYILKILSELLQHNIKTACFVIDQSGIKLRMMDSHRRILIDFFLKSENFSMYKFKPENKLFIGINLNHFHKMLKSVKKKDSVIFFIDENKIKDFGIRVIPKENNRITTSYIKIQNIQNILIQLPNGYNKPIIVPSNEYQKMCKDMNNIGNLINVISKNFFIKFVCNADSIYSREVAFGELEDDDSEDDSEDVNKNSYNQQFATEQLSRLIKISGLSSLMKIYPTENLPLKFESNIGTLGEISIYIKCKKQIDEEEFKSNIS